MHIPSCTVFCNWPTAQSSTKQARLCHFEWVFAPLETTHYS